MEVSAPHVFVYPESPEYPTTLQLSERAVSSFRPELGFSLSSPQTFSGGQTTRTAPPFGTEVQFVYGGSVWLGEE